MKISEIFASIQGEGKLAGKPSVFVRTSFCNLRCRWCDTPYTSWEPEFVTRDTSLVLQEVLDLCRTKGIRHAVITGGEPFLQAHDLASISSDLRHEGIHVTIETNGTIFYPAQADLFSVSPKLRGSVPQPPSSSNGDSAPIHWHDRLRLNADALKMFIAHAGANGASTLELTNRIQFKFVVEADRDLDEIDFLSRTLPIDPRLILLMPQVTTQPDIEIAYTHVRRMCERSGYGFSPRLHIERFGNVRAH
ncbi:MAG: 7-carboxy-7-deazaguanine synthase QueE [Nitrospirae bacterium]|nr:7-carboxy-7-deazaguanine synthase QueE [Nitrospirota bacterium]